MSGGFFRGTSADQDTRFSNKQAKLLKSQKFASELDHLVDMTKVKMDVMRPWIATRTTEFLGFEDEVLINFIYGLLEEKVVDGKKIQIQLTGFMEKNTVKFMKELWSLLLSAQLNTSGVPQQFLDAKEEEMQKKKAEADRITQEIQKRKDRERRERECEKNNRTDMELDITNDPIVERSSLRTSRRRPQEDNETDEKSDLTMRKHSNSTQPNVHCASPMRRAHSPTRSHSDSYSKSKSHSRDRDKSKSQSRSLSFSPSRRQSPKHQSISPDARHKLLHTRSISPHHKPSPSKSRTSTRRRSPYTRRRSTSRSWHRSPSPIQRRSPYPRRRSPHRSPIRDRSFSPPRDRFRIPLRSAHHRSPPLAHHGSRTLRRRLPQRKSPLARHRSPTPRKSPQRASPLTRRRSPTPRRRSPHRRSPLARHISPTPRRRSPHRRSVIVHRSSPFGGRHRSTTPSKGRSPQRRSPITHSPLPGRNRFPSPSGRGSPFHRSSIKRSLSPASDNSFSPSRSPPCKFPKQRASAITSPRNDKDGRQIPVHQRKRSHSPIVSQSPPDQIGRLSNSDDRHANGAAEFKEYISERAYRKTSVYSILEKDGCEPSGSKNKAPNSGARHISKCSPQPDLNDRTEICKKDVILKESSSIRFESLDDAQKTVLKTNMSNSVSKSPVEQRREKKTNYNKTEIRRDMDQISDYREDIHDETYSRSKATKQFLTEMACRELPATDLSYQDPTARTKDLGWSDAGHSDRKVRHVSPSSEGREYGPGKTQKQRHSPGHKSKKRTNPNNQLDTIDSSSEDFDAGNEKSEKPSLRKSYGHKREWDDGFSDREMRKEAKRKKKR
ncbi:hypothetical protein J5N97_030293 [Dioscorea zingiberensis]|uniref:PWI domain-containing protein n=1 Tax=Dioscorea zingiberensis TaxID=325984 RepID=A0A9D5BXE3_9LILI|nr:hypothetical protein J5N97_030293 [Dioscorea zingiberensis]